MILTQFPGWIKTVATISRQARIWSLPTFTISRDASRAAAHSRAWEPITREIESHLAALQLIMASCRANTGRPEPRNTELSPIYDSHCSGDRLSPPTRFTTFILPSRPRVSIGLLLFRTVD